MTEPKKSLGTTVKQVGINTGLAASIATGGTFGLIEYKFSDIVTDLAELKIVVEQSAEQIRETSWEIKRMAEDLDKAASDTELKAIRERLEFHSNTSAHGTVKSELADLRARILVLERQTWRGIK